MLTKQNRLLHSVLLVGVLMALILGACANVGITITPPDGGGDSGNGNSNLLNNQFLFILIIIMILFVAMIAILR